MRFGAAITTGVGANWWDSAAILDADFANTRFRFDGATYTDETAFLTAIGGGKSSLQRTIGPYVDPSATELIVNGTFNTDLSSWTTVLNGTSSASVVSQAARLVSDGATGTGGGGAGITQGFTTLLDKAYRALFDVVTGTSGARIGATTSTGIGPAGGTKSVASGIIDTWSADGSTSYFYGFRNGAGSGGFDNVSVKECAPFKNWVFGGCSVKISGTTPAAASGTKVAWSAGQFTNSGMGDAGDEVQVHYDASGHLIAQAKYASGTVASLDLGAIGTNTAFTVLASFAKDNFYASLNGGAPVVDTGGNMPGLAAMRIGRNFGGNSWDGSELRVQVYPGGGKEQFYGLISNAIHFEGDSFAGGAQGVSLPTTLQTAMARSVYNTGVGAATMDEISARLVATPAAIKGKVTVVWDGDNNGMTTVSAYADLLAAGLSGISRFIVIPACISRGQADISVEDAIRNEFVSRWPNNVIDWRDVLTFAAGALDDTMYAKTDGTDNVHLSQAAMDLMSTAIKNLIVTNGW